LGLGFGYTYSTAYYPEPYAVQVYDSPEYVVPSYTTDEYAPTAVYAAPTETYVAPSETYVAPRQAAQPQPAPESSSDYRALGAGDEVRRAVMDGNAAFAAGRYDEAKALYLRAVLADERDGYVKMLFAWTQFAIGDYDTASSAMRRALLTTPDLIDYPMDLRTLYSDKTLLESQTERLRRWVADRPDHRESVLLLAYLHYSIGEAGAAAGVFQGLASRDSTDVLAAQLSDAAGRAVRGETPPPPKPQP
jgi:tetratricopeptide (TPR) repeat protein